MASNAQKRQLGQQADLCWQRGDPIIAKVSERQNVSKEKQNHHDNAQA